MNESADPFQIRAHVPHFAATVADYIASSAATRGRLRARLAVSYGDDPDEKLDLFFPESAFASSLLPVHMFIHGGYWRAFSRSDYSFVADGIVAEGAIAAIVDYSLMPGARLAKLVDQVRRAAHWLVAHATEFGGDPKAISASGHSAGGHLAIYLACRAPHEADFRGTGVRAVLSVSGLFDLAPISESFLQPEISLTEQEIAQWSPCRAAPLPGVALSLIVGQRETPPFHEQAKRFRERLISCGAPSHLSIIAEQDHMTIVRALGRPQTDCARRLASAIAASRSGAANI